MASIFFFFALCASPGLAENACEGSQCFPVETPAAHLIQTKAENENKLSASQATIAAQDFKIIESTKHQMADACEAKGMAVIETLDECKQASEALGLKPRWAAEGIDSPRYRPYGCCWNRGRLQLNLNPAARKRGTAPDNTVKQICRVVQETPDTAESLRGGTWCEINAVLPDFSALTVIACGAGGQMPGLQGPDGDYNCCPSEIYSGLFEGGAPNGKGTPAYKRLVEVYPSSAPNGEYPLLRKNGPKKSLWDMQNGISKKADLLATPETIFCTQDAHYLTNDANHCMYFASHGNSLLPPGGALPPWSTLYTEQYPYREYWAGKLQPIIRNTTDDTVWILQSYTLQDSEGGHVIPGGTFTPGEDENICEYTSKCCETLPADLQLDCGLLSETATCGNEGKFGGTVFIDDLSGTWCRSTSDVTLHTSM